MAEYRERSEGRDRGDRGDRGERGGDRDKDQGFFKRRPRPSKDMIFDYKDVEMLQQFTTPGGKIVAARVSRLNAKQQRQLAAAVKRARQLALLPNGSY